MITNENWGMRHVRSRMRQRIALNTNENSRNIEYYSKHLNLPVWENYEKHSNENHEDEKHGNLFILQVIIDICIDLDMLPENLADYDENKKAFYFDPELNHPKHQEINEEIVRFTRKSGNKTSHFANFEMNLCGSDGVKTNFYKNDAGVGLIEFCFDDGTHLYVFH